MIFASGQAVSARAQGKILSRAGSQGPAEGRWSVTRWRKERGSFGRGRAASIAAARLLNNRAPGAMVKARVVRRMRSPGAMQAHIGYLKRDGVTRDGSPGRLFDAAGDDADGRAFAERCADDRHHFRFIVSPDDASELESLRGFTRDLMEQASRDLGSRLDWVAVDHWSTEHPIHILVCGCADDGSELVISRDYIATGMRARAADLVTRELGPRSELEVRRGLEAEVTAERWTRLDRVLTREAGRVEGVVDLRPESEAKGDVKAVIEQMATVGYKEPNESGEFVIPGFVKMSVVNKPAMEARSGVNPFTKEPMEFVAKPASRSVKASPLKVAKDAV